MSSFFYNPSNLIFQNIFPLAHWGKLDAVHPTAIWLKPAISSNRLSEAGAPILSPNP
jgi:hypothetical protein